ncbi:MAG: serine/threonine protein kinase [Deltaproteobacteria bacterium]|nr:serine/threonine protein kinase [Deltaproteobacteria bacterium]
MADPGRTGGPPTGDSGDDAAPESLGEPDVRAPSQYGVGDVIAAKYELRRGLRRGGIGEVWVAHNQTLDLEVAIKLIRRERASPDAARRLLQEARAVARLGHPSIVRVFDFGHTELGDPYLVMELLDGEPLDEVLDRRKRLPALNAVQLLLPVANALAAAHAKDIVHRDIKPDNVILVSGDSGAIVPKLLDFGIAKLKEDGRAPRITQEGAVLGSPAYMSPEQAIGDATIDTRSDVWSLCVVLYQAIAGHPPFEAANYRGLVHRILTAEPEPLYDLEKADLDEVDPDEVDPDEPDGGLWPIIERGLAKDAGARWPSMRELGRELTRWAMAQGAESDVAGTSLNMQWLSEGIPSAPLPSDSARLVLTPAELAAPARKPPAEERPAPEEPPSRSRGRPVPPIVTVGGVALLAILIVALWSRPGQDQPATPGAPTASRLAPEPGRTGIGQAKPTSTSASTPSSAALSSPTVATTAPTESARPLASQPPPQVPLPRPRPPAKPAALPVKERPSAVPPPQPSGMPVPSLPDF